MYDAGVFKKLERANAQIDIWIDEEEYKKVEESCKVNKDLKVKVTEKDHDSLDEVLKTAFLDESCTANKDHEWLSILSHSGNYPITTIDLTTQENDRIDIDLVACDVPEAWSQFFWGKLIRARIQQKSTDCYFRRLDQVVSYLEKHCPIVGSLKEDDLSNKLAVIYLLEMAASGEGADQRSFAERARRILKENQRYIRDESFQWFYDLFARYNIGVGYFHEPLYRKAVLEFNLIIKKFLELEGNSAQKAKEDIRKNEEKKKFAQSRLGEALLYSPAVLYRAEVQLKLQLAYHALKTLDTYLKNPSEYKEARKLLAIAEAYQQIYQQMNNRGKIYKPFEEIANMLGVDLKHSSQITEKLVQSKGKHQNLMGKLRGLLASYYLQHLLTDEQSTALSGEGKPEKDLGSLRRFFIDYKESCKCQRTEREGYLQQVAEYLLWLVEKEQLEEAKKTYSDAEINKMPIFCKKRDNTEEDFCPCKEKGINLRRLTYGEYDIFTKNIQKFFQKVVKDCSDLETNQKNFFKNMKDLEEEERENLIWRRRNIKLQESGKTPEAWCTDCFPPESDFAGLLDCRTNQKGNDNKRDTKKLDAKDYERIMDHWDEHFLEHMRDPSFHDPRCRALHFLGLQRWNSSSPAQGRSLGGGYLLYHTNKDGRVDLGIAIDPGFDFVRNLFHVGFSLADIDLVLLSHAHVDHVRDFESMVTLLLELRKRTKHTDKEIKRKLHAIMTLGVYRRLEYIMGSPGLREFVEPYILDIEKDIDTKLLDNGVNRDRYRFEFVKIECSSDKSCASSKTNETMRFVPSLPGESGEQSLHNEKIRVTITPTKAYHNDFSEYSDSFGFIINIKDPDAQIEHTFGYTGDTSWNRDIVGQYFDSNPCNTLLVHLGSLIDRERPERRKFSYYKNEEGKNCFDLIREKNHPYLMGMLHFLTEIWKTKRLGNKPLIFMSEFGEELRGRIRLDLIERLKKTYGLDIVPVDVGLDVLLTCESKCEDPSIPKEKDNKPKVWCVQCRHFVILDDADFIHYGHDEALFCVCKTCKKATPDNVLQERLRALYEVGRRLQIH